MHRAIKRLIPVFLAIFLCSSLSTGIVCAVNDNHDLVLQSEDTIPKENNIPLTDKQKRELNQIVSKKNSGKFHAAYLGAMVVIAPSGVNIRTGPGTNYPIKYPSYPAFPYNTLVYIYGFQYQDSLGRWWYPVDDTKGHSGWCCGDYLEQIW